MGGIVTPTVTVNVWKNGVLKNLSHRVLTTEKSWAAQFVSVLLGVRVSPSALEQAHHWLLVISKKTRQIAKAYIRPVTLPAAGLTLVERQPLTRKYRPAFINIFIKPASTTL